jgi:uncharacterized protein (TIGR02246 family)
MLFVVLVALCLSLESKADNPQLRAAIQSRYDEVVAAWAAGDIKTVCLTFTPDATMLVAHSPVVSGEEKICQIISAAAARSS